MIDTKDMSVIMRNRIGEILKERGISAKWLAEKVDLSANMISLYAKNKNQPTLQNAYRIASVLDLRMEDLVVVKEDDN